MAGRTSGFRRLVVYSVFWTVVFILTGCAALLYYGRGLPSPEQLENIRPKLMTKVYSSDGKVLKRFAEQRRDAVPYEKLPKAMISAVVAIEDRRFWTHWGLDFRGIARAALVNALSRRSAQGASTITQQLSRNLFLTLNVSLSRKVKEVIAAVRIERTYTKQEIIELYLNQVYFGHGMWGLQSAAEFYFGKNAWSLTLPECALLAGLLKAPTEYSPRDHPARAIQRRNLVLDAMVECGTLTEAQARVYKKAKVNLSGALEEEGSAPYFVEHIRQQLEARYGSGILYEEGAEVHTTLNADLQRAAERALLTQLREVQSAIGISATTRPVQGALVALDPSNGHILAMVGGRDFSKSQFNRATQAMRQPGSAFKPFVYTAAIDNGRRPFDKIMDSALSIPMPDGTAWEPQNYDKTTGGLTTLRDGLAHSRNLATIRLFTDEWTSPKYALTYANKMGITSPLKPYLSIALGSQEVSLLELTSAYGAYANGGVHVLPIALLRVLDKDGNVREEQERGREDVALSRQTAAIMTDMLRSAVEYGTGHAIHDRWGFTRPAAGKTGTTDDFTDAWFVGFTPQICAGVWVGFDDKVPLGPGQTGAEAALPAWARFMQDAHTILHLPVEDFVLPAGVSRAELCADSYEMAGPYCPTKVVEVFRDGDVPEATCRVHSLDRAGTRPSPTQGRRLHF